MHTLYVYIFFAANKYWLIDCRVLPWCELLNDSTQLYEKLPMLLYVLIGLSNSSHFVQMEKTSWTYSKAMET